MTLDKVSSKDDDIRYTPSGSTSRFNLLKTMAEKNLRSQDDSSISYQNSPHKLDAKAEGKPRSQDDSILLETSPHKLKMQEESQNPFLSELTKQLDKLEKASAKTYMPDLRDEIASTGRDEVLKRLEQEVERMKGPVNSLNKLVAEKRALTLANERDQINDKVKSLEKPNDPVTSQDKVDMIETMVWKIKEIDPQAKLSDPEQDIAKIKSDIQAFYDHTASFEQLVSREYGNPKENKLGVCDTCESMINDITKGNNGIKPHNVTNKLYDGKIREYRKICNKKITHKNRIHAVEATDNYYNDILKIEEYIVKTYEQYKSKKKENCPELGQKIIDAIGSRGTLWKEYRTLQQSLLTWHKDMIDQGTTNVLNVTHNTFEANVNKSISQLLGDNKELPQNQKDRAKRIGQLETEIGQILKEVTDGKKSKKSKVSQQDRVKNVIETFNKLSKQKANLEYQALFDKKIANIKEQLTLPEKQKPQPEISPLPESLKTSIRFLRQMQEIRAKYQDQEQALNNLQRQLNNKEQALQSQTQRFDSLNSEFKKQKEDFFKKTGEYKTLELDHKQISQERENLDKELKAQKTKIEKLQQQNDDLNKKYQNQIAAFETLNQKYANLDETFKTNNKAFNELQLQLTNETKVKDQQIADLQQQLTDQAKIKDQQIADLQQQLTDQAKIKDQQIADLQQQLTDQAKIKDQQIADLQQQLSSVTSDNASLAYNNEQLIIVNGETINLNSILQHENITLKHKIDAYNQFLRNAWNWFQQNRDNYQYTPSDQFAGHPESSRDSQMYTFPNGRQEPRFSEILDPNSNFGQ